MTSGSGLALVIGGSRGIGAAAAKELARSGIDVLLTYRTKRRRAEAVVSEIVSAGGRASCLELDVCLAESRRELLEHLCAEDLRPTYLVLAASGGMEAGAPPDYATQINTYAPAQLVEAVAAQLAANARVVFLTSHEAHFFGVREAYGQYERIAKTKHAGERLLIEEWPIIARPDSILNVVSADMVVDSYTARILEMRDPGLTDRRIQELGFLPSSQNVAAEVVARCLEPGPHGLVSFVGSPAEYLRSKSSKHGE